MTDRPTRSLGAPFFLPRSPWAQRRAAAALQLGAALVLAACRDTAPEAGASAPHRLPLPLPSAPVAARSPERPSRVPIPGGTFASGTEPGRFERDVALEPRLARSALGPFEIDAAPYPGGGAPPLLGLGREQAAERCAERGGRLCSELEWERACKGPDQHPFPSGVELDAACPIGAGCASGFGVWGMGSAREWTASDAARGGALRAVVRGAGAGAPASLRRCAHRELARDAPEAAVAFRCCYGPPNAARVVLPRLGVSFASAELSLDELGRLLAPHPATREIARDLAYFEREAALGRVLAAGQRERRGVTFTTAPLLWNPSAGVELLVVSARSGPTTSFVVAFDVLGDGSRRLAASFVMLDEPGPVVLAYSPAQRSRLEFSTCWGCPGETGRVLYRDPDHTRITQP